MKLWGGRFEKETDKQVEDFSSSILTDAKMWSSDIKASVAHANMLGTQNIIPKADADKIVKGLLEIAEEIQSGIYQFNPEAEDLHSEIENRLALKVGDAAKRLHTGRSRNDQVATDTRLHLLEEVKALSQDISKLKKELLSQAEKKTRKQFCRA